MGTQPSNLNECYQLIKSNSATSFGIVNKVLHNMKVTFICNNNQMVALHIRCIHFRRAEV